MKCGTLESDWKYVIHDNNCQKTVAILVLFKTGSINEKPSEEGLSHFIEHLFFQGTNKKLKNAKEVTKAVYKNGGYINAYTSYDYTGYYIKTGSEHLEDTMKILSEMLYHSKFAPKDLEREKKIVIQENRKHNSEPMRLLHDLTYQNIYKNTPLARDIGGSEKQIKKFNRNMVINYLKNQYRDAVVSISGNLPQSEKKTIDLLNKYFGKSIIYHTHNKSNKNSNTNNKPNMAFQTKPRITSVEHSFKESYVSLGFPACDYVDEKDKVTCDVLGTILAGNMNSRLFHRLREKHQYVYSVKYDVNHYEMGGDISIQCGTNPRHVKQVIHNILDELKQLKEDKATKEEVQEAIDYRIGQLTLMTEDSKEVAFFQGYNYLFLYKCQSIEDTIKEYEKVTTKDVNKMIDKIFDFQKVNIAVILGKN